MIYTIFSFFRIHIPKKDSFPMLFSHPTWPPVRPPGHPKYNFRHPTYKFRNPKYKFRHPKYKFRHPKYKSRYPKYKSRHPKYKFRHSKYKSRHSKSIKINKNTPFLLCGDVKVTIRWGASYQSDQARNRAEELPAQSVKKIGRAHV